MKEKDKGWPSFATDLKKLKKAAKQMEDRESCSSDFLSDIENHPQFENFIRAFWRRIDIYKNDYEKELPEKLPVEFRASMATAFLTFTLRQ